MKSGDEKLRGADTESYKSRSVPASSGPSGGISPPVAVKESSEVPDFKAMNDAAVALADEEARKKFVTEAVKRIEEYAAFR